MIYILQHHYVSFINFIKARNSNYYMSDQRDVAFNFIKANGPVLPVDVSKVLRTNILFASAVLSELVERKTLKMSCAAIGGSKLYYIPNLQEHMLGDKLFHALNPVEREVFTLLKENKVLRDRVLEPKQRIALRALKDFAFPLTITLGEQSEIFWKFHIITDEEAKPIISTYIEDAPAEKMKEVVAEKKPEIKEQTQVNVNDIVAKLREELVRELAPKLKEKEEEITRLKEDKIKKEKESVKEEIKPKEIVKHKNIEAAEEVEQDKYSDDEEEKELFVDKAEIKKPEGKFYKEILDFFNSSGIKVLKEEMIKKEKEYEFVVKIPSAFGTLNYFVKARDKKTFNDSDVSLAYSSGQLRKLPTILLGKGKLNKKAILLIEDKLNGQLVFKEF